MKKLQMLTEIIQTIKEKYNLDVTDLQILTVVGLAEEEGREVRVTDITRMHDIASPATLHYRVTKDLVDRHMIIIEPSTEDARVKLVKTGKKFKSFTNFLEKKFWS
jgi:uncharacterized protein (UPF0248 family)